MKERPILFSGEMVRAILEGRKTQTRRVVKPQPNLEPGFVLQVPGPRSARAVPVRWNPHRSDSPKYSESEPTQWRTNEAICCPYGVPGDRLWVREQNWKHRETEMYRQADNASDASWREAGWKKVPGIHMPRSMVRLTLEVTGVRVERLQDISDGDVTAEGLDYMPACTSPGFECGPRWAVPGCKLGWYVRAMDAYCDLWERINGAGSWNANPWVWVVEFKRVGGAA